EVSEDSFIETLDEKVKEAKANTEWRREYMRLLTIEDEKFAEGRHLGREEGRAEGRAEGRSEEKHTIYERLVSSGKLSPQEASMITGWNVNSAM
ncbi:MAG: hypothetical protein IJR27_04970, partial [Synergistaceae bacterium]|nr:hypothetical protein [Synergistaceae bacterium]